jgi:hypothetical protein
MVYNNKIVMNVGLKLDGDLNISNGSNSFNLSVLPINTNFMGVTGSGIFLNGTGEKQLAFSNNGNTPPYISYDDSGNGNLYINTGLDIYGDLNITKNNSTGNFTYDGSHFVMNKELDVTRQISISDNNNNTGTISYANNSGNLTNFVFNLPTTSSNVSSQGGLLVNNYFTGSLIFTMFNLIKISWQIEDNTSGLLNISIKNRQSLNSYSGFYNMYHLGFTTDLTPINYTGFSTLSDCGCALYFDDNTNQIILKSNDYSANFDIQLYFIGVNFSILCIELK